MEILHTGVFRADEWGSRRSELNRRALLAFLAHCERLTMSLSQTNRSLPIHSCILDRALIIPPPIYKILDVRCRKRAPGPPAIIALCNRKR
ncbi:hypothetical protein MTP99_011024 [Tenebrio molitor]|nr:hypothetical protein MTP99_011024 [Tenebrio molitor]